MQLLVEEGMRWPAIDSRTTLSSLWGDLYRLQGSLQLLTHNNFNDKLCHHTKHHAVHSH